MPQRQRRSPTGSCSISDRKRRWRGSAASEAAVGRGEGRGGVVGPQRVHGHAAGAGKEGEEEAGERGAEELGGHVERGPEQLPRPWQGSSCSQGARARGRYACCRHIIHGRILCRPLVWQTEAAGDVKFHAGTLRCRTTSAKIIKT